MDGGAWWAAVHGVTKSWTRPSDFTSTFHFHVLEKEMATHSSVLAWRIPGMVEPGGLPSMGSHRVRHDCGDITTTKLQEALGMSNVLSILPCLWKLIPNIQPAQWLIHVAKKEVWYCPVFHDPNKWLGSQTICRGLGCWWSKGFFWS